MKSDYFGEKAKVVELKKTWELANDHFIVSQDKLKREIYRLQQKLERGAAARLVVFLLPDRTGVIFLLLVAA